MLCPVLIMLLYIYIYVSQFRMNIRSIFQCNQEKNSVFTRCSNNLYWLVILSRLAEGGKYI